MMNPGVRDNLTTVAKALRELKLQELVFVGGATIGLLITDPAAPEVRVTQDVDVVTPVANRRAFHQLEAKLREAGFVQPIDGPICRWLIGGVTVDLMPPDEEILGFSNRWYADLIKHAIPVKLTSRLSIRVASSPYLVATKLEAFKSRGKGDFYASHDLEDIINLLDGREELVGEIAAAPEDVRTFIKTTFEAFLGEAGFLGALPGHLMPDAASQERASVILERMKAVVAS
jgi:predicted nucleotidyltransferase